MAEGAGTNIVLVKGQKLYSPPFQDGALEGITCDSVKEIGEELGFSFAYQSITREELYLADEVFFTGTAVGIIHRLSK